MSMTRRSMLSGLAVLGAAPVMPAWAQAIRPQSDPWAQVDPYDDPRSGFATAPRGGEPSGGTVFDPARGRTAGPQDDDAEIGQAVRAYGPCLAEGGGPVADPQVQDAINAFIRPFARVSDRPQLPWEARVAASEQINAWTVGGGKLAFNAGLVAMCDHPGELAAVVAHEMGHVDLRHVPRGGRVSEVLAAAAAGGFSPLGSQAAGPLVPGPKPKGLSGYGVLRAGFSRSDEYEADEHSLEILRRAGIDPAWSVAVMQKLVRLGYANGHHLVSELVMDHPHATDRVANLQRFVGGAAARSAEFVPPGWDALKSRYPTPAQWRNG